MRLRLPTLLSMLSGASCVATCVLGVVATHRTDTAGWAGWRDRAAGTWHGWGLNSQRGRVGAYYFTSGTARFDDPTAVGGTVAGMRPHAFHHVLGDRPPAAAPFLFGRNTVGPIDILVAGVAYWALAIALALAPAFGAARRLAGWRRGRDGRGSGGFPVVDRAPADRPEIG
jgi:hypothetical protein